jgi:hypothetical protein
MAGRIEEWHPGDSFFMYRRGRTAIETGAGSTKLTYAQREAVASVVGEFTDFIPNEHNTGLLPGYDYGDLTPVTTNFTANAGATYENMIFYCQVTMARGASGVGATFRNCVFAGIDPDTIASANKNSNWPGFTGSFTYNYATDSTPVRAADSDTLQYVVEDCEVNPGAWFGDNGATPPGGARTGDRNLKLRSCLGFRGGNGTIKRTQIRNTQDGITATQAMTGAGDTSYFHVLGVWIYDVIFYKTTSGNGNTPNEHWQIEGTHSDTIQFTFMMNMIVEGCRLKATGNSAIMLQREVTTQYIENIIVRYTIFEFDVNFQATAYAFNMSSSGNVGTGEEYSDSAFHDLTFIGGPGRNAIAPTTYHSLFTAGTNKVGTWVVEGESFTRGSNITVAAGA